MKPSRVLLISIFVTAIVLVVVGGVSAMVLANKNASQAELDQTLQAYQQREAEYNKLIEQANQQLAKANADLAALQPQAVPVESQSSPKLAPTTAVISAEKAVEAAEKVVEDGAKALKKPELVDYQGQAVYEVPFEKGAVYVDSKTGEVLFNATVPQQITAKMAAQVASEYLNIKGVLQVDEITFRGQKIYRVIFKNGTMAYLDKTGQITYVHPYDPNATLNASLDTGGGDGGGGGGGGGGSHEDHEEHDD